MGAAAAPEGGAMMRGGWQGGASTAGGLTRTYGLQRHFSRPDAPSPRGGGLDAAVLRRIAGYFRPYWRQWAVIAACIGVSSALNVLPPFCVGLIIDRAIPTGDARLLGWLAAAMVALAVVSGLIGVVRQALTARSGQGIMFDLRNQLFRHLQDLSLRFFTATRSGEIISRVNNDVNAVQHVATGTLESILTNVATLLATAVALFSRSWRLALVAVAVVPAFYLPSRLVGRLRHRLAGETQERQAALLAFMHERLHVGGALLTRIFDRRGSDADAFTATSAQVRDLYVRQAVVGRWLFMILSVFSAMGPALVYWYGGRQVIREELTPGLLVAFAALLTLLYRPLIQLAGVYADLQAAVAVFERIFEYLDLRPEVADAPGAHALERTRGHVAFEGVCFRYPARPADGAAAHADGTDELPFALQDVSFEIRPGQQVALVGPSGAGKTTVTYLLPRFYDPDAGRVRLDGRDLREWTQDSLRGHMAMVTQETFLFHASVRENLLYARPSASDAELAAVCRAANIHDFIAGLPDGYGTVVGDRGFRLSGGEKQRLSMARALLKDPAILILDEATSHLDATSEQLIQEALAVLLRGRTSLIIAHRLSTILNSDLIVVMQAGRVVETGAHAELLAGGGLYATLFHRQFSKVLASAAP